MALNALGHRDRSNTGKPSRWRSRWSANPCRAHVRSFSVADSGISRSGDDVGYEREPVMATKIAVAMAPGRSHNVGMRLSPCAGR